MLDPAVRSLLDTYFSVPPSPGPPDVAALRVAALASAEALGGAAESVASIRDLRAGHSGGAVPIRVYRPVREGRLPLLLFAHGGGWVTGSLESHDKLCRKLANRLGGVVVAVEYRCAPECVYPAALNDLDAAWHWCREEARALCADPDRMVVVGDSAGAGLAAALTLRLRRRHEAQPKLQLLLYPALDGHASRGTYDRFATGYNLTAAMMRWYWRAYAADAPLEDPELSPIAAADLAGLPTAIIAVCEADVLRDEGLVYAQRLAESGVASHVIDCNGMVHGFLRWSGVVPATESWLDAIAVAALGALNAPNRGA